MPMLELVKATIYKLIEYFIKRTKSIPTQITTHNAFSHIMMKDLQTNREWRRKCTVCEFDLERSLFEVEESYDQLNKKFRRTCKLNMNTKKCDCVEFQTLYFPCQHVVAICLKWVYDYHQIVDDVYRLETILKSIIEEILSYWKPYILANLQRIETRTSP